MFGDIFDDIGSALTGGGSFWDAALKVAVPAAKEILGGDEDTKSSNAESDSFLNFLPDLPENEGTSTRSESFKTTAVQSVDPSAIRREWIERMQAYANPQLDEVM